MSQYTRYNEFIGKSRRSSGHEGVLKTASTDRSRFEHFVCFPMILFPGISAKSRCLVLKSVALAEKARFVYSYAMFADRMTVSIAVLCLCTPERSTAAFISANSVSFGNGKGAVSYGPARHPENAVVILIVDSLQNGSGRQSLWPCQVR